MIDRFHKVCDNVYRGSAPSIADVLHLKKNFNINKIISLDYKCGGYIDRICKLLGIEHHTYHLDSTKESVLNLLQNSIPNLLLSNSPTFVHCKHGKDRTGFVCALFKIQHLNVDPRLALQEAKSIDFGVPTHKIDKRYQKMIDLYTKLILSKSKEDSNDTIDSNVVSESRDYLYDNTSVVSRNSFMPGLPEAEGHPFSGGINEQSPTRQNYDQKIDYSNDEKGILPMNGVYNNMSGMKGIGPVENGGGFIYE